MNKLILPAIKNYLTGVIVFGMLLFIPAGTLNYWQAWVFIFVFMTSASAIGIYLSLKDPELLERRKKVGPAAEQSTAQKIIITLIFTGFAALLVISALDFRFGWSQVPASVSLVGDFLVALGLFIDYIVLRENSYGSSTIEKVEGQKVITTGLYGHVRHPMYMGALVLMIGVPLALGSLWGLAVVALNMPVLVWRILDEEKFLKHELPGYTEYAQKVRYRLVPHLW